MPGPHRDLIRLDGAETRELLLSSRKVQVATLNADGSPHLVPMFFVLHDGRIAFWTHERSQKIVNLRRDPRITCLVESGEVTDEVRYAQFSGRAEIVTDRATVDVVGEALHERYVGPLDDIRREEQRRRGARRVVVLVRTERTVTWDHRKLPEPRIATSGL